MSFITEEINNQGELIILFQELTKILNYFFYKEKKRKDTTYIIRKKIFYFFFR